VTEHQVVDRLLADRTVGVSSSARQENRRFRVNNVRLLVEERDRRPSGTSAIRCALWAAADRTRLPILWTRLTSVPACLYVSLSWGKPRDR